MYKHFLKRFFDIVISGAALLVLSPLLLVLSVVGAIKMGGNPFFVQERPGKNEKIFMQPTSGRGWHNCHFSILPCSHTLHVLEVYRMEIPL